MNYARGGAVTNAEMVDLGWIVYHQQALARITALEQNVAAIQQNVAALMAHFGLPVAAAVGAVAADQ